ncbi:contact-dependent growth inhibition system immunity protein [Pseudomonas fluorescens]|uniref:contact-dependent growth inhibition system immunity protein n=1 Tax=Pseudomonas fluorescens TaxID=294 RepID=UPI000F4A7F40|nr:contact-dependent growth inhibition system immunity protein [Pseudomonas fluorescens]
MNQDFPEIHDFFGSYFHQDWREEHETADQVINDFLQASDKGTLRLVRNELQSLLLEKKDELSLRAYLLKELSCYYCYWNEGVTGELWLRQIAEKLDEKLT